MNKVLVVDDTVFMRQYLKNVIEASFQDVEVIVAASGIIALEKIKVYEPDVITLDFEMPGMNGLDCLREFTKITQVPIIMVSSFTSQGAKISIDALSFGAFDFVCKPSKIFNNEPNDFEEHFLEKIEAGLYFTKQHQAIRKKSAFTELFKQEKEQQVKPIVEIKKIDYSKIEVIGIGISTGGPSVVREILSRLPKNFKFPIMIVQHMPVGFTFEFAGRLNDVSELEVKEAQDGDILKKGRVLIAPGGKQLEVEKSSLAGFVKVFDGEKVSGHKPSADILFSSLAKYYGDKVLGIIMTGMGADGSKGLLEMRKAGAVTWAQNEETCVVYGMPKVAVEKGAVCEIMSVDAIIEKLMQIGI